MHFVETQLVRSVAISTCATKPTLAPGVTEVCVAASPVIWLTLGLGHLLLHNWALSQTRPPRRHLDCVRVVITTSWGLTHVPSRSRVRRWSRLRTMHWGR